MNAYPSDQLRQEQKEIITKKEGYEAMLYAIKMYWENSGSNDLTDILSGVNIGKAQIIPLIRHFGNIGQKHLKKLKRKDQ
jgi:hypothetical protein